MITFVNSLLSGTKLDQYQDHLYISLLLHTLVNSEKELHMDDNDDSNSTVGTNQERSRMNSRQDLLYHGHREDSRYLEAHRIFRKQKLYVAVEQVNVFFMADSKFCY